MCFRFSFFEWINFRQDSEDENPLEALPLGGKEVAEQVGLCAHVLPVFLY